MGMEVSIPPEATFYIWLDLRGLPAPLNDGLVSRDATRTTSRTADRILTPARCADF